MGVGQVANSAKQTAIQEGKQAAQQEAKSAARDAKQSAVSQGLDKAREGMHDGSHLWEGMDAPEGAQVGDKVAPGKEVGKDGKVQNTATREGMEAAANVASIFIGGAPAAGKSAAVGGAKEAAKQGAKQAAKEGAKEAAKQGAKEAGKEAAKEGAKEAAKEGAKDAAKQGGKSAAKGFGSGNANALGGMGGGGMPGGGMPGGGGGGNPMQAAMDMPGVKDALGTVMGQVDTLAGHAADELEKNKAIKKVAEDNVELSRSVNAVFNAYGAAMSGNYDEAVKEGKKAVKEGAKYTAKVYLRTILLFAAPVLGLLILVVLIILPFKGGYLELSDFEGDSSSLVGTNNAWSAILGADGSNTEAAKAVVGDVPGFDELPLGRKAILVSGALAIGTPYYGGGRPTSATLAGISGGVDSGGFLEWLIWNVTGSDPGYLPGSSLASNPNFEVISQSDLIPGDIGVNGDDIGLYMGNGEWIIVDPSQGVIRTQYNGFNTFYRYKSLGGATGGGGGLPDIDPGPSAEIRDRVLTVAKQLVDMHIPYNVHYPDNQAKSLNINLNNWFQPITSDALSYLGRDEYAKNKFGGMDCCSFVGYVYSVAINEAKYFGMCGYINAASAPAPGFTEVSLENAQPGDMIKFIDSKGVGCHMAILVSKEANGLRVYEEGGWGTRYYTYDSSTNMISPVGSKPDGNNWIKSLKGANELTYGYGSYTYKYYRYTEGLSATVSGTYDDNKPVSRDCKNMINALWPNGVPSDQAGLQSYQVATTVPITKKDGTKTTKTIYLHKLIANDVVQALQAAQDEGFVVYDVQSSRNWDRCISSKGGATCGLTMSQHCYGLAVDINVAENPYVKGPNPSASSPYAINHNTALYRKFKSLGWGWGGDWKSKQDYMHFSYMGT